MRRIHESLIRSVNDWRNRRLRGTLAAGFAAEAAAWPAALQGDAEERLWSRIAGRREWEAAVVRPAPARRRQGFWAGGLAAAAVAAAVILVVRPWPARDDRVASVTGAGIKGGDPAAGARLTGLRYATVDGGGRLIPGADIGEVIVGRPLVFSAEAEGVSPASGLMVDLEYMVEGSAERTRIGTLRLTSDREILRDTEGALAFVPEQPGRHVFILSKMESGGRNGESVSLAVEVVAAP